MAAPLNVRANATRSRSDGATRGTQDETDDGDSHSFQDRKEENGEADDQKMWKQVFWSSSS